MACVCSVCAYDFFLEGAQRKKEREAVMVRFFASEDSLTCLCLAFLSLLSLSLLSLL